MQPSLPISLMALGMGILLSAVAGYFSVIGIATIFSGAWWSVIIMAGSLEASKIIAASWIYRNWIIAPLLMRIYMILAVIVLVIITSMGIFGYLSKAHLDQTINQGGNNDIQIQLLERRIESEQRNIRSAETVLTSLDQAVQTLVEYDRIRGPEGALAVRQSQKEERAEIEQSLRNAQERIDEYQIELIPLKKQSIELEAEIGPLKYIAELIYGDQAKDYFDVAVRWIIILLVSVFDPLAICLLLAGNAGLVHSKKPVIIDGKHQIDDNKIMKMDSSTDGHNLGLDGQTK